MSKKRTQNTAEHRRLTAHKNRRANWKQWGPYLADRAWGTVREDYSPDGNAWEYFSHDDARSRAYRWNEDGLMGISDRSQYLCFSWAFWNGRDPILKERLYGLTGPEGNHAEDVKELYFYVDSTPTHSYMKAVYKYPQAEFPYEELIQENGRRNRLEPEYELLDTGVFDDSYFDITAEYAKADEEDILIQLTIANRGMVDAVCHALPTLWFRNTWDWGYEAGPMGDVPIKPTIHWEDGRFVANHPQLGTYYLYVEGAGVPLFTENETNSKKLFEHDDNRLYVKDGFHEYLIDGNQKAVNPACEGTKAGFALAPTIPAGKTVTIRLRLTPEHFATPFRQFDRLFAKAISEADEFYDATHPPTATADEKQVQRQAWAGMMWSKQLFYLDMEQWSKGDPGQPEPPDVRKDGRNSDWLHLTNFDIISMPDKWEYPWYAAWDSAFHCLPLAEIDPEFAKRQMTLFTREWYMHPNGQIPAYEWSFSDVNPPVHAWAALKIYQMEGEVDRFFLEAVFQKLLLNFTWWVNRKDADGNNIFQGGFLGLDNIGVFDRSAELPVDGHIDQADGTAWMAFYSLQMLAIALELAKENTVYQDLATKFFEHYIRIAHAMSYEGDKEYSLWDEEDGIFYDALHLNGKATHIPLKVKSLVGLSPLIAVLTIDPTLFEEQKVFARRTEWFLKNRPVFSVNISYQNEPEGTHQLFAIATRRHLERLLQVMLDEDEFLSPYGIRSMSKYHEANPYVFKVGNTEHKVAYQPAESDTALFGGNSNWRGPLWLPFNYLLIESLRKYHAYYGDDFYAECPTGSGNWMTLDKVADELTGRLTNLFVPDAEGKRPLHGSDTIFQTEDDWQEYILFYEYFHGDNGAGLGASHQTGWTGLIATLISELRRDKDG